MILSLCLLLLALAGLALAALTVVPAPAWLEWRLAVLAGEYGHGLAIVPLTTVALAAWWAPAAGAGLNAIIVLANVAALGLFLRPVGSAARIARTLPDTLRGAFGPANTSHAPFSWLRLLRRDPAPVPVHTHRFAPGLELDLYPALPAGARPAPGIILVHGGGWNAGDRRQVAQLNAWLARHGIAVAAVSYRLAPEFRWPAQEEDVLAAIRYVHAHAAGWGVDPGRLILAGRSAGGQIAEVVAYAGRHPAIRGVIGLYAPSDLNFGYAHAREDDALRSPELMRQFLGGTPATAPAAYARASAMTHVTSASVPTLLLHGRLDTLVWHRHSERLLAQLAAAGVPGALVSLPWASHAFEYNVHGPGGQLTTFALEWFVRAVTAAPRT